MRIATALVVGSLVLAPRIVSADRHSADLYGAYARVRESKLEGKYASLSWPLFAHYPKPPVGGVHLPEPCHKKYLSFSVVVLYADISGDVDEGKRGVLHEDLHIVSPALRYTFHNPGHPYVQAGFGGVRVSAPDREPRIRGLYTASGGIQPQILQVFGKPLRVRVQVDVVHRPGHTGVAGYGGFAWAFGKKFDPFPHVPLPPCVPAPAAKSSTSP